MAFRFRRKGGKSFELPGWAAITGTEFLQSTGQRGCLLPERHGGSARSPLLPDHLAGGKDPARRVHPELVRRQCGRYYYSAAIVPAGTNRAISVFVTNQTDAI